MKTLYGKPGTERERERYMYTSIAEILDWTRDDVACADNEFREEMVAYWRSGQLIITAHRGKGESNFINHKTKNRASGRTRENIECVTRARVRIKI